MQPDPSARVDRRAAQRRARWRRAVEAGRSLGTALILALHAGWHLVVAYAALAVVGAAVPLGVAWLTRFAIDTVVHHGSRDLLVTTGAALAGLGTAVATLPHATRYVNQELQRRVGLLAQDRLFAAAGRLVGLVRFEDPLFLDRLRLAQESGGAAPGQIVTGAMAVVRAAVTMGGFLGSLLLINPWMAAVVLVGAVPALVAQLRLSNGRAQMMWRIGPTVRREMFYRELLTGAQAVKELRLFGVGDWLRARLTSRRRKADTERRRMDRRDLSTQALLGLLGAAGAGATLLWALIAAAGGAISVGDISLLVAAVAGVQGAVAEMVGQVALSHNQMLMFGHYLGVVRGEPDLPVRPQPHPTPPLRRGIELRDVWFRYGPGRPWVLRGMNLTIPYGRSVALVGRNGTGKSTLVKLLCRMYDPERGAVLWDGVDLRDMDPAQLRARIGAVFQDFMQYDLTVAENIALGDLDVLDALTDPQSTAPARVARATERAGATEVVAALPLGYDTLLSRLFLPEEMDVPAGPDLPVPPSPTGSVPGTTLSGGQWQRLALARALLREQRDLLILDEPSSGLDAVAEYDLHRRLRAHRAGRTSLLISHRLGAVRDADLLVVLRDGQVTEQGSHRDLMRAGGEYARLYRFQAAGYLPEDEPAEVLTGRRGASEMS